MPYTIELDQRRQCLVIEIQGPFSFMDYSRMAQRASQLLAPRSWDRLMVDNSRVQHTSITEDVTLFPRLLEMVRFPKTGKMAIVCGSSLLIQSDSTLFAAVCDEAGFQVRQFRHQEDALFWLEPDPSLFASSPALESG